MKAFGYLIAGAALLPELVAGLNATADEAGWRYQGCYSDKQYTGSPGINEPAVRGVSSWPRTLNGLFFRNSTNTGRACRNFCASNQFTVAATNNDQCWCDNAIAKNGTSIIAPSYGIRDLDDRNCQQPCPGNATEACGNNTANANLQRLTLYQLVSGFFVGFGCLVRMFGAVFVLLLSLFFRCPFSFFSFLFLFLKFSAGAGVGWRGGGRWGGWGVGMRQRRDLGILGKKGEDEMGMREGVGEKGRWLRLCSTVGMPDEWMSCIALGDTLTFPPNIPVTRIGLVRFLRETLIVPLIISLMYWAPP